MALLGAYPNTSSISKSNDNSKTLRYVQNDAFGFGEKLDYRVGYKFITAGRGSFEVMPNPVMKNGRPCYDIRFDVKSLESLEWIYQVRDRYRTVMDVGGMFPWEFEQHIREGGYKRDFTASFSQETNKATTTEGTFEIPDYVHDVVSALFYVRTLNLAGMKKGEIIKLQNFFDRKTHELGVKVLGKQTIEVEAGKFRCIVVEPMIQEGGLFKSEGRILVWFSDDARKVPVKVSSKIPIGTVDAELTGYKGLRGPLQSIVE